MLSGPKGWVEAFVLSGIGIIMVWVIKRKMFKTMGRVR